MIVLDHVAKRYSLASGDVEALRDASLTVERGEFVAVVGSSGSGKSTLLNIVGLLDQPTSGTYLFQGEPVSQLTDRQLAQRRNRSIGFVFQAYNLVRELTLRENVELPLSYDSRSTNRRERSLEALATVGLADRAEHRAAVLSGGEQQRAAIARALVTNPDVILADEPTGSIDQDSAGVVLNLLDSLHRQGRTIVMVTHQPDVAARAQRRIRLANGCVEDVAAEHRAVKVKAARR